MMIIKKIKPLFRGIVTTATTYAVDECTEGGLIDPSKRQGTLKEYQTVVTVGTSVTNVKVGDLVHIDIMRFAKMKPYQPGDGMRSVINGKDVSIIGFEIPIIKIDDVNHLYIQETDVDYVVEEWEEKASESSLIIPSKQIIVP